jgi:hypothetical protein
MWYGYGHGSPLFLVVLVIAIFALRMYAGRRRPAQGGPPGSRPPRSASFQGGAPSAGPHGASGPPGSAEQTGPSGWGVTHTGISAGWMVDPSGRHERRYWSGTAWTDHVTDNGAPSIDPLPTRPPTEAGPGNAPGGDGDRS